MSINLMLLFLAFCSCLFPLINVFNVVCDSGDGDAGVVNRVKMILEKGTALINTAVDTNGGVHLSSSN